MRPVLWSAEAKRDHFDILHYIANDNPFAAEKVINAIERTGSDLGRYATGRPGRVTGTYEKPVTRLPHIIAYALATHAGRESIIILRVIHTSRDWPTEEWPG
jgi:plasmid stabilization system protein ParE